MPVFKKGSKLDKDSFRQISVLSSFTKSFEEAVYRHLYNFLDYHNVLCPLPFGFRQKCSTKQALINITESICQSVDKNEFGCGIFVDLKKAFDTVNHSDAIVKVVFFFPPRFHQH